jgi:hypothetical protein
LGLIKPKTPRQDPSDTRPQRICEPELTPSGEPSGRPSKPCRKPRGGSGGRGAGPCQGKADRCYNREGGQETPRRGQVTQESSLSPWRGHTIRDLPTNSDGSGSTSTLVRLLENPWRCGHGCRDLAGMPRGMYYEDPHTPTSSQCEWQDAYAVEKKA